MNRPRVSVVIPVFNQLALLEKCLESLRRQTLAPQVICVDDASPEDPAALAARETWVTWVRLPENAGYAAANNAGLAEAMGDFLLFLNSDTELAPDTLQRLVSYLEQKPEAAGLAVRHREPNGTVQRTCFAFPTRRLGWVWFKKDHPAIREFTLAGWEFDTERWVDHGQTSCLMIRREVYERIGGMDPRLRLFYNDTDFCRRMAEQGYRIWFTPEIEIIHHGGASVGTFGALEAQLWGDRYRYYRKWFGWRGAFSTHAALWSRLGYEALWELAHGDVRRAMLKFQRAAGIRKAMVP